MRGGTDDQVVGSSTTARARVGSAWRVVGADGRIPDCINDLHRCVESAAFDGARIDVASE